MSFNLTLLGTTVKLNETNTWVLPVDEEGVLTLPDELWEMLGWREGDTIEFVEQEDGSFLLVKTDETTHTEGATDPTTVG